jgi:hypothetical protein
MPVKVLTPQQRQQYGRFATTISSEQIAKHCYLTPNEISRVVARRPQVWQQLGYAIQLMTVCFLGTFLELKEALKVPKILMAFATQQLHLHEIPDMTRYRKSIQLIHSHCDSIREQFGYTNFSEAQTAYEEWLKARILRAQDSELELFDLSTAWCVERKILLPAASTLERVIASIHDTTLQGLWSNLPTSPNVQDDLSDCWHCWTYQKRPGAACLRTCNAHPDVKAQRACKTASNGSITSKN